MEKEFKCRYCDYTYKRKYNVQRHEKVCWGKLITERDNYKKALKTKIDNAGVCNLACGGREPMMKCGSSQCIQLHLDNAGGE